MIQTVMTRATPIMETLTGLMIARFDLIIAGKLDYEQGRVRY